MKLTPFHVAIPVFDLQKAKEFYIDLFECEIGRTSKDWVEESEASNRISRLENEVKHTRRPLAACEVLPRQLGELVAANPWLKAGYNA